MPPGSLAGTGMRSWGEEPLEHPARHAATMIPQICVRKMHEGMDGCILLWLSFRIFLAVQSKIFG